jgi:hypothetical protein
MSQTTNCNHDPKHQVFYDGALGYEAIVCRECGAYCDHNGAYPPDEWSLSFLPKKNIERFPVCSV